MGGAPSTLPNISDITLQTASNANIDGNTVHTTSVPATARNTSTHLRPNEKEIIKLMLPVYYLHVDASPDEIKIASDSWELILNDKSPEFLKRKENDPTFQYGSCMIFFYDSFYTRLFDMHPICRPLFLNGIKIQGRFLVKMLSLSISVYQDPVKFDHALLKLAEGHYHGGVKSVEYGIVGEVLFWALRNVLGAAYTFELHTIWVKIYSRMLRTIVPAAVAFELKGETEKQLVRPHRRDSHLFPMGSLAKPEENPTESTIPQSPTSEKKVDTIRLSQGIEVMSVEYTPMQLALLQAKRCTEVEDQLQAFDMFFSDTLLSHSPRFFS